MNNGQLNRNMRQKHFGRKFYAYALYVKNYVKAKALNVNRKKGKNE